MYVAFIKVPTDGIVNEQFRDAVAVMGYEGADAEVALREMDAKAGDELYIRSDAIEAREVQPVGRFAVYYDVLTLCGGRWCYGNEMEGRADADGVVWVDEETL